MAASTKETENFDDLLTCTICLETFKVPKYLPCLHTFCESCIDTYIVSSNEKDNTSEGFRCPVCRMFVSFKGKPEKPEAWASKLPNNHFVTSMLDKRAIQRSEKMCNSCQVKNKTKEAVSWCTTCEEAFCAQCEDYHKSFKITSKHTKAEEKGKGINEIVQNRKQTLDNIQTQYENILQEISKLKERAIEHLNKIEEQINFEMCSSKKQVDLKLTDEVDKFSNYKSMVNNWERLVIGTIRGGSDQQCLLEVNKIGSKFNALEEEMNEAVKG
ncbi:TRIM56 [Mytilus edulis]|uniref:TRIM56 n=1 Tax=Mytilus edulis TaxID=6550 RepID=A0A8S3VIM2_MYTED|nr:TRIM56 [Mytilus edulis]